MLIWILPIKNCLKCIKHCCCRTVIDKISSSMNYQFEEDLYRCLNYTSLKEKLIATQDSLEKARAIRASQQHERGKGRLSRYIETLVRRRDDIDRRIDALARSILGKEKTS